MTIVSDIPTKRPIIDKAIEYSNPAATSLLGIIKVAMVEKIFVKNPLIHKGIEITKTLNNN